MKKLSFKSVSKAVTDSAVDGAVLYAGMKGYQVVNKFVGGLIPTADAKLRSVGVALLTAVGADMVLPARWSKLAGAVAMAQAADHILGPSVDKFLLQQNLIEASSVSAANLVASTQPATTQGYSRVAGLAMGGYTSTRMAGYSRMAGPLFPSTNLLGLPG